MYAYKVKPDLWIFIRSDITMSAVWPRHPALIYRSTSAIIRGVNRGAGRQQRMRQGWTAIVGEGAEPRSTSNDIAGCRITTVVLNQVVTGYHVAHRA